jgi:hypothetical protein
MILTFDAVATGIACSKEFTLLKERWSGEY